MTIKELLALATAKINSDSAKLDAEVLLAFTLEQSRTWLATWPEKELTETQQEKYLELVKRRVSGEPIAYITGEREFWTLSLTTNESTLIPRPETELLVEQALEFLTLTESAKVLDLGTGTGAIALAIACEREADKVYGCDFNAAAVELAQSNAVRNQVQNVKFFESDWFSLVTKSDFNLIVSNPPYVAAGDPHLQQGDLVFEPNSALIAKDNGFADIKIICDQARNFLTPGGAVMFEHGFEQGEKAREIMLSFGYSQVETIQDLAGQDRITRGVYYANG